MSYTNISSDQGDDLLNPNNRSTDIVDANSIDCVINQASLNVKQKKKNNVTDSATYDTKNVTNPIRNQIIPSDQIRRKMWHDYFEGTAALQAFLEADLKQQLGVNLGDYTIMLVLWRAEQENQLQTNEPTGIRLGQLAQEIVYSPARLTYRINRLVSTNLLRRVDDQNDRRASMVELTLDGKELFKKAQKVHLELVQRVFLDTLDDHEAHVLQQVFERLNKCLRTNTANKYKAHPTSSFVSDEDSNL